MKERSEAERIAKAIRKTQRRIEAKKPNEEGRETWEAKLSRLTLALLRAR